MIDWNSLFSSATHIFILVVVILAFSYSAVMLNRRQKEKSVSFRLFFIFLHLLVSVAILSLLLQPRYQDNQPVNATLYVVNQNHLFKQLEDHEYLYIQNEMKLDPNYLARYKNQIIFQPEQILLKLPTLTHLLIVGDGLLPSQLARFTEQELMLQANPKITGVIYPSWQTVLYTGNQLVFKAIFQSNDQAVYQVQLFNPANQIEDEVSVINGDSLVLEALPKVTGTHLYRLVISDQDEKTITEQSIPIEVKEPQSSKILLIQSAPSFETKQIQNWAGDVGAELLIRTRISKNKYITRSTNLSQSLLPKSEPFLTEKRLSEFDILITDARAIQLYNTQELNILSEAIKNGLGLVVRVDDSLFSLKESQLPDILSNFTVKPIKQDIRVDLVAHNQLNDDHLLADSVRLGAEPLFNLQKPIKQVNPLITTPQGHVVVAQKYYGLGKVTLSAIKQSEQLKTADQARAHSQLWSHIIQTTAKPLNASRIIIENQQGFLLKNRRMNVCVESASLMNSTEPNLNDKTAVKITALKNPNPPHSTNLELFPTKVNLKKFCGSYWPNTIGWHKFNTADIDSYFYVDSPGSWRASQQQTQLTATQTRIANWSSPKSNTNGFKTISDWYYWLLIIVCSSLIWIERKFWSNR